MTLKISLPANTELEAKIQIWGVGGGGGNAIQNMSNAQLAKVEYKVLNTDWQALSKFSPNTNTIQLGIKCTKGLGAGSYPEIGRAAAEESLEDIIAALDDCHMLFIAAGMGGGTGTGAAPVISKVAKERGILTVGVVTKPFHFEGARRMKVAELGLEEMAKYIDTLIVIPNQNLFRVVNEKTTFAEAFKMADHVLYSGVRSITDLITMPGLINLDFADISAVMKDMGKAMMGTGEAEGEERAIKAAEAAISNPLLDHSSMKGAKGVLINITGGADMTLFEVDEATNHIKNEVEAGANIIFGAAFDDSLQGKIRISVVATGIDAKSHPASNTNVHSELNYSTMTSHTVDLLKPGVLAAQINMKANNINEESTLSPQKLSISDKESPSLSLNIGLRAQDQKSAFIPPKAVDPEEQMDNNQPEPPQASSLLEIKSDNKPETKLSEMFGKVFSRAEHPHPQSSDSPTSSEKVGEAYKEDLFEIPAFLRKKK